LNEAYWKLQSIPESIRKVPVGIVPHAPKHVAIADSGNFAVNHFSSITSIADEAILFILVVVLFGVPELNVFASGSVLFYVTFKHIDDSMRPTLVWFSDF
jgi:hypothetical protein